MSLLDDSNAPTDGPQGDHPGDFLLRWQQMMNNGGAQAAAGPAPLTPAQLALQKAQAGTPLPQGFNPANMLGGMGGMPVPQGYGGALLGNAMPSPTMGYGGAPAVQQASTGGNQAALGAVNAGLGLMQNSQPQTLGPAMPSMLGGGGTIPQPNGQAVHAAMGPGAGMGAGMGGGMPNPQILKMLMGAGNGTA